MSEEAFFSVVLRDFRATELTTRNRFRDKLKIRGDFDGRKFKSKKELIGGGDVHWSFRHSFEYKIFSWTLLEQKELKIKLMLSKEECYGSLSVDLHTMATGPIEHNLPVLDWNKRVVGRLNFFVEMEQIANVAVVFKEITMRHLKPVNNGRDCNPYLKYAYSKEWTAVQEGKAKACYAPVKYNTTDPHWDDLPELRFEATLKEILHESIVLHVTHNGKITNTTLGRCNLLFRTLVDNGKTFKDEDLISFKGPLKVENAEIEGTLIFKFLPRFAQMKPVNVIRKAIHTEKGIFDAVPLIVGLPQPHCPIVVSSEALDAQKVLNEEAGSTVTPKKKAGKLMDKYKEEKTKSEKETKVEEEEEKKKESKLRESQRKSVPAIREPEPEPEPKQQKALQLSEPPKATQREPPKARKALTTYFDPNTLAPSPRLGRTSDKLFPHAEDHPSPRINRRTIQVPEASQVQKDLIAWSPVPMRKAGAKDPFLDFLTPSNPFLVSTDGAAKAKPTFNPFEQPVQQFNDPAPNSNPFVKS